MIPSPVNTAPLTSFSSPKSAAASDPLSAFMAKLPPLSWVSVMTRAVPSTLTVAESRSSLMKLKYNSKSSSVSISLKSVSIMLPSVRVIRISSFTLVKTSPIIRLADKSVPSILMASSSIPKSAAALELFLADTERMPSPSSKSSR